MRQTPGAQTSTFRAHSSIAARSAAVRYSGSVYSPVVLDVRRQNPPPNIRKLHLDGIQDRVPTLESGERRVLLQEDRPSVPASPASYAAAPEQDP